MNTQNGSALILSLLILLVMTMLGITAMSTSSLQEKMASNDRNQKITFQNAELNLTDSEETHIFQVSPNQARDKFNKNILGSTPGYYGIDADPNYFDINNWVASNLSAPSPCIAMTDNDQSGNKACTIIHVIKEELALEAGSGYNQTTQSNSSYKIINISSRSADSNNIAASMVQSTVRKIVQ